MATIFTKIAAGEIPSYKCAESADFYAFLDISPLTKGHTLVIPRKEVDYIFDMDDAELAAFQVFAKKVAQAIRAAFPCRKVAQVVLGLEVPHAHIHLMPINSEADVYRAWLRARYQSSPMMEKRPAGGSCVVVDDL